MQQRTFFSSPSLSLHHITERENTWRYPYLGVNCSPHPSICGAPGVWASSIPYLAEKKRKVVCQHGPSRRPAPGASQRGDGVYWLRAEESGPLTGNSPRPRGGQVGQGGSRQKKEGVNSASANPPFRETEREENIDNLQNIKDWRIFSDVQFGRKEQCIIILDNVEKNDRGFFLSFDVLRSVQ
jgi:hypothetical protein